MWFMWGVWCLVNVGSVCCDVGWVWSCIIWRVLVLDLCLCVDVFFLLFVKWCVVMWYVRWLCLWLIVCVWGCLVGCCILLCCWCRCIWLLFFGCVFWFSVLVLFEDVVDCVICVGLERIFCFWNDGGICGWFWFVGFCVIWSVWICCFCLFVCVWLVGWLLVFLVCYGWWGLK